MAGGAMSTLLMFTCLMAVRGQAGKVAHGWSVLHPTSATSELKDVDGNSIGVHITFGFGTSRQMLWPERTTA